MRILLVEDDPNKGRQISNFLSTLGIEAVDLARSYTSGLKSIRENHYDLILLDMSLPNYDPGLDDDAGRFRSFAGRDILNQMSRRAIKREVLIITQYEAFTIDEITMSLSDLADQLEVEFSSIGYRGIIYYNSAEDDWKTSLSRYLGDNEVV